MQSFPGVRDFVAAVTGGNTLEQAGFDAAQARLIKQRREQATLDRAIEQAALAKDINFQRGNALGAIDDPLIRGIAGANSGFGANFSAAQSGEQTRMENESLAAAMAALENSAESGEEIPVDLLNALNALKAGKLLAPANVQVQEQASANIGKSNADIGLDEARSALLDIQRTQLVPSQVRANEASVGQRGASADLSRARTAALAPPVTAQPDDSTSVPVGETLFDLAPEAFGLGSGVANLGQALDLVPGLGLPESSARTISAREKFNRVVDEFRRSLSTTRAFKELEEITKSLNIKPSAFIGDETVRERILAAHDAMTVSLAQQEMDSRNPSLEKKIREEAAASARRIRNVLPKLAPPEVIAQIRADRQGAPTAAGAIQQASQIEGFDQLSPEQQQRLIQLMGEQLQ